MSARLQWVACGSPRLLDLLSNTQTLYCVQQERSHNKSSVKICKKQTPLIEKVVSKLDRICSGGYHARCEQETVTLGGWILICVSETAGSISGASSTSPLQFPLIPGSSFNKLGPAEFIKTNLATLRNAEASQSRVSASD